jgi:hypothetical protein
MDYVGVRWAWVAPLGWMVVMGLFAGGCGPSDGSLDLGMDSATEDASMPDTSVPDAGPTLTPCTSNVECAGGEVCRAGFCRTSCSSASECTGALSECDEDAGYCVGCTLDEHCGANEACVDRTCEFFCRGNTACDADEYCVLATGACAERECELSNQCPGGFRCDSFLCVPIDDIVCVADSVTCSGENTAVLRCNADGTMEAMEACDVGTRCVAEAGAATCDAILCEANELGCADNATAFVCDATGTVRTDTDCGAGRYCASGACQDQVCTPSSVSCMGAGVLSCDALGAAETFEACSARAECSGSSFGCSCASGSCMTRVCVPASTRCAVTGFQTCSADGLSWGNVTGCAMDETCVPALGTCAPVLCTANSRECMTDVLVACDATGTVRTTTNCAASSQICTGSGPSAACTARVCVPGSLACNAGFDSVLECDARGASLSSTACPSGDYCSAGGCVAEVCTPGSLSRCLGGDVRQCNAIGSAYQLMDDCTASETCVENASGGACVAHVCTPSAVSCTGDDLVSCAANGLSQSTTDCQSVMSYCSAGACLPWVCTPGSVDCTGTGATALRRTCNARGTARSQVLCGGILGCNGGNSACAAGCGDGVMQGGEECDDGNVTDDDGCTNGCEINNRVLRLDGNGDGVVLPRNPDYGDVGTQFTIEAWVKPVTTTVANFSIIYTRRANYGDYALRWSDGNSGRFGFDAYTDNNILVQLQAPSASTVNTWHHVAGVVDGRAVRLYVDGNLVASATAPADITWRADDGRATQYSEYATFIGHTRSPGDGGAQTASRFEGDIDDVRVSSAARYTGANIAPAMWLTPDEFTVGLWRFDESSGSTATDASPSSALDGVIEGATRVVGGR